MTAVDVFRDQPVLTGKRVRLVPLSPSHLDGMMRMLTDPEARRLTGTHRTFERDAVREYLAALPTRHDRAHWAITSAQPPTDTAPSTETDPSTDGDHAAETFLGEAVLQELDGPNATAGFRICLAGPDVFGQGYGTESTKAVVDYALDVAGLHRVGLEVFDFNVRAQRVCEKCGFVREGIRRRALWWNGIRHDVITMGIIASDPRPA